VVGLALPPVDEVPAEFPAVLLWRFRMASAGAQLIMWTTIGWLSGVLAERVLASSPGIARYAGAGAPAAPGAMVQTQPRSGTRG
jgi:hypothetical protein